MFNKVWRDLPFSRVFKHFNGFENMNEASQNNAVTGKKNQSPNNQSIKKYLKKGETTQCGSQNNGGQICALKISIIPMP